jgi:hypothetical protein
VIAGELAAGSYTVLASVTDGLGNTTTANQELTIEAAVTTTTTTTSTAASTPAAELPFTGRKVVVLSALVVGLLLVGATLLRAGRRPDTPAD